MKKKLEAELISIAHRILKLKNKSELDQLHMEAQKLYEKLSVLKFVEENFAGVKPTIGQSEAQEVLETAFDDAPQAEQPAASKEEVAAEISAEADKKDKPEVETPEVKEDEKIQEPETPPAEKVNEDAETEVAESNAEATTEAEAIPEETAETTFTAETPEEKEVDEVIAEAENDSESKDQTENTDEKPTETPVVETPVVEEGINFEEPEAKEEVAAAVADQVKEEDLFKPTFEWAFEPKTEAPKEEKPESNQIAFDDLLGSGYKDPVFVKPEELAKEGISYTADELPKADVIPISRRDDKVPVFKMSNNDVDKSVSLNDRLSKGITVGLNDRIAFVKNLFNNSNEDYNRVLSQLITFDTFSEAQDFIDNMVKPDYNNWDGKDEYAQRFMEAVEKKFS